MLLLRLPDWGLGIVFGCRLCAIGLPCFVRVADEAPLRWEGKKRAMIRPLSMNCFVQLRNSDVPFPSCNWLKRHRSR